MNMLGTYTIGLIDMVWPMVSIITITIAWYVYKDKINSSHWKKTIPTIFLIGLLATEGHFLRKIAALPFEPITETLAAFPLHLCSISAVLIMLYVGFRKEIFVELLLIQGIFGSLITFAFPDTTASPIEFGYWAFFIPHIILFVATTYFMIVEGKRMTRKALFSGFILVHIAGLIAVFVNETYGFHYMYVTISNSPNLFDYIPINGALPFLDSLFGIMLFGEVLVWVVYLAVYYIVKWIQGDYKKKTS